MCEVAWGKNYFQNSKILFIFHTSDFVSLLSILTDMLVYSSSDSTKQLTHILVLVLKMRSWDSGFAYLHFKYNITSFYFIFLHTIRFNIVWHMSETDSKMKLNFSHSHSAPLFPHAFIFLIQTQTCARLKWVRTIWLKYFALHIYFTTH